MKTKKEAEVFDIIFRLIVNTVRETAVAKASWLMLSSMLLFHLQNYWTLCTWYWEMALDWEEQSHAVLRHQTVCLIFTVLVTTSQYTDHDGNADNNRSGGGNFLGQIVPGNFGGKAANETLKL